MGEKNVKKKKNATVAMYTSSMSIKVYPRRWFLLALFMLYTSNVSLPWMQFASITNIVSQYYNVPGILVESTSIMMMASRTFLLVPSLFLIDKLETKNTIVLASALCLIGSCIKLFSIAPNRFYLAMTGHMFNGFALVFTYSLIGRFSAAWFSSEEISRAGAFCYVGDIVGAAFSFLLPSRFVPDTENVEEVETGMRYMHYCYTAWSLVTLILITIFFKSKPSLPPSAAQMHKRSNDKERVYKSVKVLLKNRNFLLFILSQGILVGCGCNAVGTLLNEMMVTNFPNGNAAQHTGVIGFIYFILGIIGSMILSLIQDKTRKYKCMAVTLSFANCVSLAVFTASLKMQNIYLVYITYSIYGFFMQGYYATTIQMGIELSFPVPEGVTVATISVCVELVSMISTFVYGLSMRAYGDLKTNICATLLLFLSSVIVCLVPPKYKREELEKAAKEAEATGLLYGSTEKPIVKTVARSETTVCEKPGG